MDERAWFDVLYHENAELLFRLGRRLCGAGGEDSLLDVIQDVFLTAWSKRAELMVHPNPGGWLVCALKLRLRGASAKIRREELRRAYSLDEEDAALPVCDRALTPEQSAVLAGHIEQLRALLDEENADIFIEWALMGKTAADIAKDHYLSVSCVWMRISRARRKLAQYPELFYIFLVILTGFDPPRL